MEGYRRVGVSGTADEGNPFDSPHLIIYPHMARTVLYRGFKASFPVGVSVSTPRKTLVAY